MMRYRSKIYTDVHLSKYRTITSTLKKLTRIGVISDWWVEGVEATVKNGKATLPLFSELKVYIAYIPHQKCGTIATHERKD